MKKTNALPATWRKGYIVTGVLTVVLLLLAVMPLGVSAAYDYDNQAIGAFEQSEFASFDSEAAYEPMSIDAFADVGVTPFSGGEVIWKPHAPVVTVPMGQNFVYIYFTLYRPYLYPPVYRPTYPPTYTPTYIRSRVATPMGSAGTTMQLIFPQGAFSSGTSPAILSFVFIEPDGRALCTCCFTYPNPHWNGTISASSPTSIGGGYVAFGGTVTQLFHRNRSTAETWDHYGEIVIRVRMMIGVNSPVNTVGFQDITIRRGEFSQGEIGFPLATSTVRVAREVPLSFENLPARGLPHVGQRVEQNSNLLLSAPGTAQVAAGSEVRLNAGTVEGYQFLGWIRGSLLPPLGANLTQWADDNNITVHVDADWQFNMPGEATTYTAVWGNDGIVGVSSSAYHIAFHIYTGNQSLIDRFGGYGTPNANGILVINVPVTPGTPYYEWPNQNLLNAVLSIGFVEGTASTPGYAFWGWFTGETLDNSGRTGAVASPKIPNPTNPGFRRPYLTDRCEWMNNRVDRGPQYRTFDRLQDPYITEEQIYNLFGSSGTLDLFAIWSLWGDVDDNDKVNFTDLSILETYLLFRLNFPTIRDLNRRAADVSINDVADWSDFNLIESYLLTRRDFPGQFVLGVVPPPRLTAFTSFNASTAFDPMSIAAFADVDIAPLSDSNVTWQPQSPIVTVPIGQNFVYLYFTLDRPDGVATPIGNAGTSIQLVYPQGSFAQGTSPVSNSFVFIEPDGRACTCCFTYPNPHWRGTIAASSPSSIGGGYMVFGGTVLQLFFRNSATREEWYHYGEIVIRVRLGIPAASPVNTVGYQDIAIRRGEFSIGDTGFPMGISTVRVVREGSPAA